MGGLEATPDLHNGDECILRVVWYAIDESGLEVLGVARCRVAVVRDLEALIVRMMRRRINGEDVIDEYECMDF